MTTTTPRPLARWTLGPVRKAGQAIFLRSIKAFRELYPEFDNIICCNNLDCQDKDMQKILDYLWDQQIPMHQQSLSELPYPIAKPNESIQAFGWKLLPPRLRSAGHELWIDNDILFQQRVPEISEWLNKNTGMILRGIAVAYGRFHHMNTIQACAGFFGLPPHFDFKTEVLWRLNKNLGGIELDGYDEQGLVACIVTQIPGHIIVSQSHMTNVDSLRTITYRDLQAPAIHFVGANRTDDDPNFNYYLGHTIKPI